MDYLLDMLSPDQLEALQSAYDAAAAYGTSFLDYINTTWSSIVTEDIMI